MHAQAIQVWNALADGWGNLNWAGLGLLIEFYGCSDVEALVDALIVIKAHRPDKGDEPPT